jgi:Fe-S-cluster containining protein
MLTTTEKTASKQAKNKKGKKDQKGKAGKTKVSAALKITAENKCSFCVGSKCCNYVTQQIDTPRGMADFDTLLWQLSHPQVQAYKDEDGWFLMIIGVPCSHLLPSGACGIYEKRPMICREYSNDCCEFDEDAEDSFKLYFEDSEQLDSYCRKRFKKWDKRFKKWLKK